MVSNIGWIDFSAGHRQKVMQMMDLLKEKSAVDELGIGVIRDRLADHFFPGTSTIQTRAKYFLLVPWIIQDVLQDRHVSSTNFIPKMHELEYHFIDVFKKNEDTDGIIGKESGRKLKRKPSEVYWTGFRKYHISPLKGSLADYARNIDQLKQLDQTNVFGRKALEPNHSEEDAQDQQDAELIWRMTPPPPNWKGHST